MTAPEDQNGLREALDAFEEAVRDEVRWAPQDTGQYPNHRVALRKERRQELDAKVASLIADRASLRAAEAEITRLTTGVSELSAAYDNRHVELLEARAEITRLKEGMEARDPRVIAAAWKAWHARHGGKLGPGPAFVEAIRAGLACLATLKPKEKTHG